jgi:hypothetical protein
MGNLFSMLPGGVAGLFFGLLFLAFVPAYFAMRWRETKVDPGERDPQLSLKSFLYLFQVVSFQVVVYGLYMVFDFVFGKIGSEGPTSGELREALGMLLGAAVVFVAMGILIAQTNAKQKWYPQKVFYGINMLLTTTLGVWGLIGFFGALLAWKSGKAFHQPMAMMLVYLPVGVVTVVFQMKLASPQGPPPGLAGGIINSLGGSRMQALSDQAAAGMAQASASMEAAAQQPQQPQQPQPPQQPGGGPGPSMVAGSPQPQQPQAQPQQPQPPQQPAGGQADPAVCPSCGGRTRYIAQYNRTWCDNCQRYL